MNIDSRLIRANPYGVHFVTFVADCFHSAELFSLQVK